MSQVSTVSRFTNRLRNRFKRNRKFSRRRTSYRPVIDPLEARNLLTTFTVINDADSGPGSLRQAIIDANASPGQDTVKFDLAADTISLTSGQIVISDDLKIKGPGAANLTINGVGDRVFAVVPPSFANDPDGLLSPPAPDQLSDAPSVRIEKLSIENGVALNAIGYEPGDGFAFGGGIYNMGGSLQLKRVQMSDNLATGGLAAGGAVANEFGGTLTVSRSQFENNQSVGVVVAVGGAITSDLGATVDSEGNVGSTSPPEVHISRSHFAENAAETQTGYVDAPAAAFSGVAGGGAILNVTGQMTITKSHFEGNGVSGGNGITGVVGLPDSTTAGAGLGGAVLSGNISPFGFAQSSLHISSSTFEDNSATGGSGELALVDGGLASGGAVALTNGADARLVRNQFKTNSVQGGPGTEGGIGTGGAVSAADTATLRLRHNRFRSNSAGGGAGVAQDAAGRGGALGLDSIPLFGFGKTTFPDGSMPFAGPAIGSSKFDTFHANQAVGGIGGGIFNDGELSLKGSSLTDNEAIGQANVSIDFVPGYSFIGAALGGGVSNIGSLEIDDSKFDGNVATGADGAVGLFFGIDGAANYPGLAVGGGLHNVQEAVVEDTRFKNNDAIGGDLNIGSFAGVANGGGIYNDGSLEVYGGSVRGNRASAGDNNFGDINAGGGYGGGITSGSVTFVNVLLGGEGRDASLVVHGASVRGNEAIGGANNVAPTEVPPAHKPSGGIGGGIVVYQGSADISKSSVVDNHAKGGDGGLGAGGGIFFFGFVGTVDANLSASLVARNTARGGDGADGLGGGIATGSLGSLFSLGSLVMDPGLTNVTVDVHRTAVVGNLAKGGEGGNGLGGGLHNGSDAATNLQRSLISVNKARGGLGGDGIGGGIYNLGDLSAVHSLIFANWASTSDDNCFGC